MDRQAYIGDSRVAFATEKYENNISKFSFQELFDDDFDLLKMVFKVFDKIPTLDLFKTHLSH